MFNIGFTELIILAVIGLLVVGPEQLPDLARKIAKILNELRRAKDEIMAPLDEMKTEAQLALQKFRQDVEDQNSKIDDKLQNLTTAQNPTAPQSDKESLEKKES